MSATQSPPRNGRAKHRTGSISVNPTLSQADLPSSESQRTQADGLDYSTVLPEQLITHLKKSVFYLSSFPLDAFTSLSAAALTQFSQAARCSIPPNHSIFLGMLLLRFGAVPPEVFPFYRKYKIGADAVRSAAKRGVEVWAQLFDSQSFADTDIPDIFMLDHDTILPATVSRARFIVDGRQQRFSGSSQQDKFKIPGLLISFKTSEPTLNSLYVISNKGQCLVVTEPQPGSVSDIMIYNKFRDEIWAQLQHKSGGNPEVSPERTVILGDQGFGSSLYPTDLVTKGSNQLQTPRQSNFTESQKDEAEQRDIALVAEFQKYRIRVECYFGRLVRKFQAVRSALHFHPNFVHKILKACCFFVNIMVQTAPVGPDDCHFNDVLLQSLADKHAKARREHAAAMRAYRFRTELGKLEDGGAIIEELRRLAQTAVNATPGEVDQSIERFRNVVDDSIRKMETIMQREAFARLPPDGAEDSDSQSDF